MDVLLQLVKIFQEAADYLVKNWPAIATAIANLVAALYVLVQLLSGLLPFFEKAWEIIKNYFVFVAKVGGEILSGARSLVSKK